MARFEPNAYELLLMQCLLRIKCRIPHTLKSLERQELLGIVRETNLSERVVFKIFGRPRDKSRDITFNEGEAMTLYQEVFGTRNLRTLRKIIEPIVIEKVGLQSDDHIPKTYALNVEPKLRYEIVRLVERKLKDGTLCEAKDIEGLDVFALSQVEQIQENTSDKLKKFLNTAWYIYLYFPHRRGAPELLRSVLKIHGSPDHVETIAPNIRGILNDYSCTMRFDKKEQVLIFDGTTKEEGARALHIKVVIGNREELPDIALGEYNNIEPSAAQVHAIRVVLKYAGSLRDNITPKPRNYPHDSPELEDIDAPIKDYLKSGRHNYRITPPDAVFTVDELQSYLALYRRDRYVNKNALVQRRLKVAVSIPRYGLDPEIFESYRKPIAQFLSHLVTKTPDYQLAGDYFLMEEAKKKLSPRDFDFYIRRIDKCDILVAFCPTENFASECVAELALAIHAPRAVYLIAPHNRCIPEVYRRGGQPPNLRKELYSGEADLETLGDFLVENAPYSEQSGFLNYRPPS